MPRAFFNDIHELKCGQAEEKLEAGGDEKLIFNFIWPKCMQFNIYDINKFNNIKYAHTMSCIDTMASRLL